MTRKEKLQQRAKLYGRTRSWSQAEDPAQCWQDGYCAALKDARRAIAADVDYKAAASNLPGATYPLFPNIRKFLEALR